MTEDIKELLKDLPPLEHFHLRMHQETADTLFKTYNLDRERAGSWTGRVWGTPIVYDARMSLGDMALYTNDSHWNIEHCSQPVDATPFNARAHEVLCGCGKGNHRDD